MRDDYRGWLAIEVEEYLVDYSIDIENVGAKYAEALRGHDHQLREQLQEHLTKLKWDQRLLSRVRAALQVYRSHDRMITPVTWVQCEELLMYRLRDAKDVDPVRKFLKQLPRIYASFSP